MKVNVSSQQSGKALMDEAIEGAKSFFGDGIVGSAINSFTRGGRVVARTASDLAFGRKAVVGEHALSQEEIQRAVNASPEEQLDVLADILRHNRPLADQNSLEAFKIAQGEALHKGQELSVGGLDAVRSRYYSRQFNDDYSEKSLTMGKPGESNTDQIFAVGKDVLDVATFVTAGTVGLKLAQAAVSVLPE